MTIKDPPNWGNDPLSDFIKSAYENSFATFVNMKKDYGKLQRIDTLFREAIDYLHNSPDWFIGFFLLRAHSAYLGAARLSTSAQVHETYMVLRGCLESALYGFYISKDQAAKKVWVNRHENEQTLKLMRNTFQMRSIFLSLKETDNKVHDVIEELYQRTIDFGAHPNPHGIFSALKVEENEKDIKFKMNYLTNDPDQHGLALKTTAQVGVGALLLFRFVYPERFEIMGVHDEIKKLAKDL